MIHFTGFSRCDCGAITMHTTNDCFSCKEENFHRFFPEFHLDTLADELEEFQTTYACDWCVNHYGLDICACGSGKPFETCEGGFECCGTPMQTLKKRRTMNCNKPANKPAENNPDLKAILAEAIQAERRAKTLYAEYVKAVVDRIQNTPVPGTTRVSSSPDIVIVKASAMMQSPGTVLSAGYYSVKRQADYVEVVLQKCLRGKGVEAMRSSLAKNLQEMVSKKRVVVKKMTYPLNETTLEILAEALRNLI